MIGVAPNDCDIKDFNYKNCGWYLYCKNSTFYSGPPYNYDETSTGLQKVKNEVKIIMDMNKKVLTFFIDDNSKYASYTDIPINKPIAPAVFLFNKNDSVEITDY